MTEMEHEAAIRGRHQEMAKWLKLLGPLLQKEAYRALRELHGDRGYLLDVLAAHEEADRENEDG